MARICWDGKLKWTSGRIQEFLDEPPERHLVKFFKESQFRDAASSSQ